ncbi:sensor histidine kinase [Streptomyces termitum]
MRTTRSNQDAAAPAPQATARGRRAHAGPPADEPEPRPAPAPRTEGGPEGTDGGDGPGGPRPAPHGRGLRPRTVRAKIVSLLMVPVVSLLVLWGLATVTTAQDMARLRQLQRVDADIRQPVSATLTALQEERGAAARQLAAPGAPRADELKDRIRRTDAAVARLGLGDGHTVGDSGDLPAEVARRVGAFVGEVRGLARLRTAAVAGTADWDRAYREYTAAVSAGLAVGGALAGLQDAGEGAPARVLLELARADEMLAREDTLLGSAHLSGRLTVARQRTFTGAAETRRTLLAAAAADLPPEGRAAWERIAAGADHIRLVRAEDRVSAAVDGRPAAQAAPAAEWDPALTAVRTGLAGVGSDARAADDPLARGLLTPEGAAVALGLAAVAASLVISVRIGRSLVVELVGLRNTALGIARRKLPAAMGRLRAGEEIDIRAEAPRGPAPRDEVGQVGEALTTVHRAALEAAVERAELAGGISGVFVNLARRSQVLVHRQLNLLDSMERRADDPGELDDLFRLDHLTTRMRRHAESLIILSGAAPGRAWRRPVPLTDVVRAAVSEIEDYARVEVRRLPETAVAGGAVADLTHLIAELVENAAQFSPPHTKVRVSGEPVGNGYALEIEDRGLGMGRETLAEANARIEHSEALDLFDSDRLGLFVVSRLAARHAVKVRLRPSPYGGTTAVVLLPTELLQGAPDPVGDTGAAPAPGRDAGTGAERTAREHAETRRAEARRFAGPPAASRTLADPRGTAPGGPVRAPAPLRPTAVPDPAPAPVPAGVTALRPRVPAPAGHGDAEGDGGLPRRVRQASLVPQLREAPAPDPAPEPPGAPKRTPEQVRDRMAAYRDGWRRGGAPAPGEPAPPAPGAHRPAVPRTAPAHRDPHARPAPYDPRTDARARTGQGPRFGPRPTPYQPPRTEGDDA